MINKKQMQYLNLLENNLKHRLLPWNMNPNS